VTGRLDTETVERARAMPVTHEIYRRGIKLRRQGSELVGACPVCGDGGKGARSDRFAVSVAKNTWLCRRCPAGGSAIDLVMHLDGVDFRSAIEALTGERAPAPRHAASVQPPPADDGHKRAMRLWDEAVPIAGTLAVPYLTRPKLEGGRGLALPTDISPRVLRFHHDCPFGEGTRHPCLLALYRSISGDEPRAIMRTALTPDARKIDRKALGPVGGAAIKLSDDGDVTMGLVIGEGLETTISGMVFGFAPAWALGSAGAIRTFPLLSGIEALTILAEDDDDGENEKATLECFRRWTAAGREVLRAVASAGGDANDALARPPLIVDLTQLGGLETT
jgi:hypothetical protein